MCFGQQFGISAAIQFGGRMDCGQLDSVDPNHPISEAVHNVNDQDQSEKMKEFSIMIKRLRHQPLKVVIERLFIQGEFNKFTEVYSKHDGYYFQKLCTSWGSVADCEWTESVFTGRFILQLPHPAHAVFLFQRSAPLVPESVNAWAVAKRCDLYPDIMNMQWMVTVMKIFCPTELDPERPVFHGKVQLSQFHEKRSVEGWQDFSKGLIFLCTWWGQPGCPHLEGGDMKTATVALAKEEDRIAFRNKACEADNVVLNTVKTFLGKYGITEDNHAEIIKNIVALVIHSPNLKWRLARILHEAAAKAEFPTEIIEVLRYKYGPKQYTQTYFSSKRRRASESDKANIARTKMGEIVLKAFSSLAAACPLPWNKTKMIG